MAIILLVESDVLLRNRYQLKLEQDNNTVLEASNGIEAHKVLSLAKPDLIILDLLLPVKDGFTFLSELKQKKKWAKTPILVITSLEQDEDRAHAMSLGATEYLIKDHVTPDQVRERVAAILDKVKK